MEKIKNAPIDILADGIIKTNDAEYIYLLKYYIKKSSSITVNILADAICKTENAQYIYEFAADVKNAPIDILTDAIIQTKDSEYISKFIITIENADTQKLVKALIQIGDVEYICCIAEYLENFDRYLHQIYTSFDENDLLKIIEAFNKNPNVSYFINVEHDENGKIKFVDEDKSKLLDDFINTSYSIKD